MKHLILIALIALSSSVFAQFTEQWKSEKGLDVPEAVLFYEEGNCLFVSNIAGKPTEKNGKGFIAKLTLSGEIMDLKWVDGLNAPKGMAIKNGVLYVSNIDELVLIDINKATIIKRIHQPKATFLNDMTVTHQGDIIVSDSGTSTLFVLKDNKLDVWLHNDEFGRINGLLTEEDYILLGTANSIVKIDVDTKRHSVFLETGGQADGLVSDGQGGYYYSFWRGELFHYEMGKEPVRLLHTAEDNTQTADIGFNPNTKEVYVPTFFGNQVVSYIKD